MAKHVAQPDNRPIRNFTSFSASLRCMDTLILQKGTPRTRLSSTSITDKSTKVKVGADEMLINAINQMNVKSKAFVFIDQSYEKDPGQIDLLSPIIRGPKPHYYFRGAITQLDSATVSDSINFDLDFSNAPHPITINGGALKDASPSLGRGISIVSVDLHLVSYPNKIVLPGGSIANSMVITNKSFGTGSSGLIKLTGFDMSIAFNRVESVGQAVRNLIELGVIELLGRQANVPYWNCLNIQPVSERLENQKRNAYLLYSKPQAIHEAQSILKKLGHLNTAPSGRLDRPTHRAIASFQASEKLIATGQLDYDTHTRLKQKTKGYPVNGRAPLVLKKPPVNNRRFKRYLSFQNIKSTYHSADNFEPILRTAKAGYLYCFQQTNHGKISRILPSHSQAKSRVIKNSTQTIAGATDGYRLTFETSGEVQTVLCTLVNAPNGTLPRALQTAEPFQTVNITNVMDIVTKLKSENTLDDWVLVSRTAR